MVGGKDLLIIIRGHYGNCSPAGCVSGFLKPQNNQRTLKEYISRLERGRDDKSIARVQVCLARERRTCCPSAGAEAPALGVRVPAGAGRGHPVGPGPAADTPWGLAGRAAGGRAGLSRPGGCGSPAQPAPAAAASSELRSGPAPLIQQISIANSRVRCKQTNAAGPPGPSTSQGK